MENFLRKLFSDFSGLLKNMTAESLIALVMSFLTTIGASSFIKDYLDKQTWISEIVRTFFLYPLCLFVVTIFGLFIFFTGTRIFSIFFARVSEFSIPLPKARIDFRKPLPDKKVYLEICNSERKKELLDISIRLLELEQLPDKFGNYPIKEDIFERIKYGLSRKTMDEKELKRKSGGSVMSGEVCVQAGQLVSYYLFELDKDGYMRVPKLNTIENFPEGRYLFEFEFSGYVDKKSTPDYLAVTVFNTGEQIIVESIEPR